MSKRAASCVSLSNQRQAVFFGFTFACSWCSLMANAAWRRVMPLEVSIHLFQILSRIAKKLLMGIAGHHEIIGFHFHCADGAG